MKHGNTSRRIDSTELQSFRSQKRWWIISLTCWNLIHADQETKDAIRGFMNRCLLGENVPNEWREARIHTVHKKGDPKVASNYRGIAIMQCKKLYANILSASLQRYVNANNLLPDTQNDFRPKRSAIDN